jgi:hypothetical protein
MADNPDLYNAELGDMGGFFDDYPDHDDKDNAPKLASDGDSYFEDYLMGDYDADYYPNIIHEENPF